MRSCNAEHIDFSLGAFVAVFALSRPPFVAFKASLFLTFSLPASLTHFKNTKVTLCVLLIW